MKEIYSGLDATNDQLSELQTQGIIDGWDEILFYIKYCM